MPLSPAAENELRSILRSYHAAYAGMAVPTGAGKALEAFVFFKLAQAAGGSTPRSWRVSLHRGDGTALPAGGAFNLPGGPSRIQSSSVSAPCYALIRNIPNPTLSFELRGSVQWMGRSQTKHEVDISVLPSTIGEKIRNNGGGYPQGLPIAAIECKDKLGKGDLDEARQTLARMFDLAPVTTPPAIAACRVFETNTSSHWGKKSSKYRSFFNKCHIGVVRASGFSRGVGTLFTHYHLKGYADIYTNSGSMTQLEADFRENISHAFDY